MPMRETGTGMILNTGISTLQSKEKPIKRRKMQQFKVGDKVILNPEATFCGPVPSPRIFTIKHLVKEDRYILDCGLVCNSHQILSIPLFKEGDLVQVHPNYGSCKGKQSLDKNIFRVLNVKPDAYTPSRPGEDGYSYLLDTSSFLTLPAYIWKSSELGKVVAMEDIKVDIDELNGLLDECLNDLNNNSNENQLQREDTSVPNRDNEEFSGVHGRRHQARVSISHPKHQKGVRG